MSDRGWIGLFARSLYFNIYITTMTATRYIKGYFIRKMLSLTKQLCAILGHEAGGSFYFYCPGVENQETVKFICKHCGEVYD